MDRPGHMRRCVALSDTGERGVMFSGKGQWDEWGPQGHALVAEMAGVFRSVDSLVRAGVAPDPSAVEDAAATLERLEASRLNYQNRWADIARRDTKRGGAYTLLAAASFIVQ